MGGTCLVGETLVHVRVGAGCSFVRGRAVVTCNKEE